MFRKNTEWRATARQNPNPRSANGGRLLLADTSFWLISLVYLPPPVLILSLSASKTAPTAVRKAVKSLK